MKRFLAVLTALALLAFRAPPARASDAESLRLSLEQQYGISILMGRECPVPEEYETVVRPGGVTAFQILTAGNSRFSALLEEMSEAFSAYPEGFFSRFYRKRSLEGVRFYLVDVILNKGVRLAGLQSVRDRRAVIYLSLESAGIQSIHHEIWHAMECRLLFGNSRIFAGWTALNPRGFSYIRNFFHVTAMNPDEEPKDWFVREYSKLDEMEDRATVFEAVMTKDASWWDQRPRLQKKARFMLKRAKTVFGSLGSEELDFLFR